MNVRLIQVPSHAGDEHHASAQGPARLVEAGAGELLAAYGIGVELETIARDAPFRDTAASSARTNRNLADAVRAASSVGELPIVLAGSCNAALGVVAGFEHARCGVVWIDAHADFNTPESTTSGFFPGMSAAVLTGRCYSSYWGKIGDNTPIAEENVAMFGVRELSPDAERDRLERSAIRVVRWQEGTAQGDVLGTLDDLRVRVADIYLHVDFDAFAPDLAPGVADDPVPGGLSFDDAATVIRASAERFRIRAATLATFTPDSDEDDKTLQLGLRLVELLGEYAVGSA
jgi:arginase